MDNDQNSFEYRREVLWVNIQHLHPHQHLRSPPYTTVDATERRLRRRNRDLHHKRFARRDEQGFDREVGEPAGETLSGTWDRAEQRDAHFRIGMDWLTIDVYTGTAINALTRVATSSGSPSAVNWTAVAGTTYRIRLTKNTHTSGFALVWSLDVPPPNDDFADAIVISTTSGSLVGTNKRARPGGSR